MNELEKKIKLVLKKLLKVVMALEGQIKFFCVQSSYIIFISLSVNTSVSLFRYVQS